MIKDKGDYYEIETIQDALKLLAKLGYNVIIKNRSQVTAGCILSGRCRIGSDCWISPNVSIDNNISVGNNSVIGMGSVIRKNINEKEVVAGNPAKKIKKLK